MISNRAKVYILAGLAAVALVIVLNRQNPKLARRASEVEAPHHNSPAAAATVTPMQIASQSAADAVGPKSEEARKSELERLANTSIAFFGKVVDDRGEPIEGAATHYTVHRLRLSGNPTVEGPRSDSSGLFSIHATGPAITVAVTHPDFYSGSDAETKVDYAASERASRQTKVPTLEMPVVFRLRKKGMTEPLIHSSSRASRVPLNGTPAKLLELPTNGTEFDVFEVVVQSRSSSAQVNEFQPFEWVATVQVPHGGLIERSDAFSFEAPNATYSPSLTFNMTPTDAQWSSRLVRDFFVRFASGRYARVQLTLSGDTGFCRVEYFLNPTPGSRNLEFDPAKQIKAK